MKNDFEESNVLGLLFFIFVLIFGITIGADHTGNLIPLTWFGDMSSFFIILSFTGFTYIKKDKFEYHQLGTALKMDIILGLYKICIIKM